MKKLLTAILIIGIGVTPAFSKEEDDVVPVNFPKKYTREYIEEMLKLNK